MTTPFVDFRNVWLAYNEELLAQNHFAVEDISLQMNDGEFHCRPLGLRQEHLHEAHHGVEDAQPR
jgi:hypothetical protein